MRQITGLLALCLFALGCRPATPDPGTGNPKNPTNIKAERDSTKSVVAPGPTTTAR